MWADLYVLADRHGGDIEDGEAEVGKRGAPT
jgi:hypothetical protein